MEMVLETWYAHTSKMYVKKGDTVKAGDVIAAVGSTGNSTGHICIWKLD